MFALDDDHPPGTSQAGLTHRLVGQWRRLIDRRRAILTRVVRTEDDLCWLEANVEPGADEAQEEAAAEVLQRLDDLGRAEVAAVDGALARLARGEYGLCGRCGEPIPWPRLEALPEATECVGCAGVA